MYKILVYSPIKYDATSFYRAFGPFRHLAKHYNYQIIDLTVPGLEVTWDFVSQGDILFCQRPSTLLDISIMDVARGCGLPIWIDYDDDYLNIPETNPRHELYANPHRVEIIKRAIAYADVISVSTPGIRDSIIKRLKTSADKFWVIPNAVDESMFETSIRLAEDLGERNTVLWRGGDTHNADIKPYLDVMVDLYNEFPQYTWAFLGHVSPDFLKKLDTNRVILYPWEDVMIYFDRLFDLRPKVTLVPWEDNTFNAGKSNCSFLESTLAGAVTVFPGWHSEAVPGMILYDSVESFHALTQAVLASPDLTQTVRSSLISLQKFTLLEVNQLRFQIVQWMMRNKSKLGYRRAKYTPKVYDEQEFFNYTHEKCLNQDYDGYREGHYKIAQKLLDYTQAEKIVEFGCGPGPMIEYFCDKRVPQVVGFDTNPHFKTYFEKRNPHFKDVFINHSFLDAELDGVFDLAISIECFEHIPMDALAPFIAKMANHFRFFYFSSTPYQSSKTFDYEWGHVNVQTTEKWTEIFEAAGFKKLSNPQWITSWDLLFESTRITFLESDASPQPSDSLPQSEAVPPVDHAQSVPEIVSS